MGNFSLVLGILSLIGMLIGFIPCFGALNWINIPFAVFGIIISIVALSTSKFNENNTPAVVGLMCCIIAIFVGIIRLFLGGGIF